MTVDLNDPKAVNEELANIAQVETFANWLEWVAKVLRDQARVHREAFISHPASEKHQPVTGFLSQQPPKRPGKSGSRRP
jgi:hypothetical protein